MATLLLSATFVHFKSTLSSKGKSAKTSLGRMGRIKCYFLSIGNFYFLLSTWIYTFIRPIRPKTSHKKYNR